MMEGILKHTNIGDLAMLVSGDRKQFFINLKPGEILQTHRGILKHDDLIDIPWGSELRSHLDARYHILEPTLRDLLLQIKRHSQIIYPKDIGYILLRLSIGPGKTVVEAGTGSGALTTALAWMVGPDGKVISYDRRADMQDLARRNLEKVGLLDRVDLRQREIAEGFDEQDAEALFLDLPSPHTLIPQARAALRNGGVLGVIVPTTNQVNVLLESLQRNGFHMVEVCEILLRFYKPVPERLRPVDRMIAHTGFLIFARAVLPIEGEEDL
jgi:tRNA (adenine57-N1/adenine58-N1)-methyltransferase